MNDKDIFGKMLKVSKNSIANGIYFLLLPCCFVYYLMAGFEIISPFLNGYFSIMASVVVVPLMFHYLYFNIFLFSKSIFYDFLFFIFICYYTLNIYIYSYSCNVGGQVLVNNAATVLYMVVIFLIFKSINIYSINFYRCNYTFCILMLFSAFIFMNDGAFVLIVKGIGLPKDEVSYQLTALIFIISASIILSKSVGVLRRYFFYSISVVFLYLNGARSEFIVFVAVIPFVELIRAKNRLLSILMSCIFIVFFVASIFLLKDSLGSNRNVDLLKNTTQSKGFVVRVSLAEHAIRVIAEHPILGSFGEYESGHYAHNVLSIWADLGVFGLVLYCLLLGIPFVFVMYSIVFLTIDNGILHTILFLLSISFILIMFSKSYHFLLPIASFGLFSNFLSNLNPSCIQTPSFRDK